MLILTSGSYEVIHHTQQLTSGGNAKFTLTSLAHALYCNLNLSVECCLQSDKQQQLCVKAEES